MTDLAQRAALLDALIQSAPQAVLAVSTDGKVLAANRRFEELWGLPPGSIAEGGDAPALLAPTRAQVVDAGAFDRGIRWGQEHPRAVQRLDVPLHDGRVFQGVSSPIVDPAGTFLGRIWFLSDDTNRRSAEAEREHLLEQLQVAQRSQAFLLDAARVLARARGYDETLQELAALAVPTLGDLCLIDVVDDGRVRRMAARHADPKRQVLVDELARSYAPDPDGAHPILEVVRTGVSRWSATMSDSFLRATTRDERHFELTKLLEFTSYVTVPLVADGAALGAVTLVSAGSGRRFGPADARLAEDLARQVAEVVAKARRYEQEHEVASTLQASLLPTEIPTIEGLQVAARYLASTSGADVGGDWFDVVRIPAGLRLTVGDVAGHDIGAAAAMGQLRSACRALAGHAADPGELVTLLHGSWDHLGVDRIATMVVVDIVAETGSIAITSAGHPPPLLVGPSGSRYLEVEPGRPLGAPPGRVHSWRGVLAPGETLVLYTDGLVERRDADIDHGLQVLACKAAALEPGAGAEEVCDGLLGDVGADRGDDIALLAVARQG